jgi:hypothetical protein
MYLVIPTSKGEVVLDSLSGQKSAGPHTEDRMEQVAQSLTAILKCTSCFVYASESHSMVLEVQVPGTAWVS